MIMLACMWDTILNDALPAFVLALLGYLTFWLRSHIGKSNGHGPLNKKAEDLHQKVSRLEKELLDKDKED